METLMNGLDPVGHSGGTALVLLLKKPDVLLSADISERQSPEYMLYVASFPHSAMMMFLQTNLQGI